MKPKLCSGKLAIKIYYFGIKSVCPRRKLFWGLMSVHQSGPPVHLGLLAFIRTTSHVFKVRMYTQVEKCGRVKTRPVRRARPLAACYFSYSWVRTFLFVVEGLRTDLMANGDRENSLGTRLTLHVVCKSKLVSFPRFPP